MKTCPLAHQRISHRLLLAASGVLHLVMLQGAIAFEGWEHEDLGNIAITANIRALEGMRGAPASALQRERVGEALRLLKALDPAHRRDAHITYGSIVRMVDFMRDSYALMLKMGDPERDDFTLIDERKSGSGWPKSWSETNTEYLKKLFHATKATYLSAAHANHDHFQGRVFYTYWFWHKQAVETAGAGNLWGALLLNAYADHFLQDSFAPGHIVSPRDENSHDLWVRMIHDSYNKNGMEYRVRAPEQCRPALQKLLPLGDLYAPVVKDSEPRDKTHRVLLCGRAITKFLRATEPFSVWCYGDGDINKGERLAVKGAGDINKGEGQAVLIAANCVQSLTDVIDSFLKSTPCNSFDEYRWNIRFATSGLKQLELIDVSRSYGDLVCVDREFEKKEKTRDMLVSVVQAKDKKRRLVRLSAINEDLQAPLAITPNIGVSVGMQGITKASGSHVRALAEVEGLIHGGRWDYSLEEPGWPSQYAVTAGYSALFGPKTQAHGAMVRLVCPAPKLNLQVSIYAGGRYYSGNSVEGWGTFEGVRLEWGMHLCNLFFGVGHDHYPVRARGLVDGISFEAGFSAAAPFSLFHSGERRKKDRSQ